MSRSFVGRVETSGRRARGMVRSRAAARLGRVIASAVETLEGRTLLAGNITLSNSVFNPTGDTNLTTEGNLDYVHLGYNNNATATHVRNGTGSPRISGISAIGGGAFAQYDTAGKTFTWTNAQPPPAADFTAPTDPIVGTSTNHPGGEAPPLMFDNTTSKYLNFDELNAGATVTPAFNGGNGAVVNAIRFYTANDAVERDPASYKLEGSNDGGTTWVQIAAGNLALPDGRNPGGQALSPTHFQQTVNFSNTTSYKRFRVTFPTVKNAGAANSMQIGEVELLNQPPPENAAATTDAAAVVGDGKGFSFTVPAVADPRKLRIYVGADGGSGVLTATLSDGTAAPFTATLVDDNVDGAKLAMYELTFQSGLNNEQTLKVDYVAQGGGTAIFSGASWVEAFAPVAARNLKATTITPGSITMTWNQRAFTETSEVLQMSSDNGATWQNQGAVLGVTANPNLTQPLQTRTINNLLPNRTYQFRVQSTNLAGTTFSPVTLVTTQASPPGSITGSVQPGTGDSNLSGEGNLDWVHWGFQGPTVVSRSTTTGPKFGGLQIVPPTGGTAATPTATTTSGKTFSWAGAQWLGDVTAPTDAIVGSSTNHPGGEPPSRMFDNTTSKYLNFDKLNTGARITLTGDAAVVGGMRLYTANDDVRRDPASYTIEGSNDGGTTWTSISSGPLALPASRNGGGQALDPNTQFQQTVSFNNTTAYKTYRVLFPTVKDAATNSMQIGEVELLSPQTNATVAGTADAIQVPDGQSFRFTVPATRQERRLRVYVGADGGSGVLTATLSDNSVAPFTATLVDDNAAGAKYAVYELVFRAGFNDAQTMTVTYTAQGGAAILSGASWAEFALSPAPTGLTLTPTGRGKVNIAWTDASFNETGFRVERSTTADGSSGWTTVTTTAANATQALDSGLSDTTQYFYRVSSLTPLGASPTNVGSVTTADLTDANTGVMGNYFNSDQGRPLYFDEYYRVLRRQDANINFNWTTSSPDGDNFLQTNNYSVQWDGEYVADYTGPTTFFTDTDDGGRLFIDLDGNGRYDYNAAVAGTATPNGELVVNAYVDQGLGIDGVNNGRGLVVNMVAGQRYKFRMQMYENGGGSAAFMYVQTAISPQGIVPRNNLIIPAATAPRVVGPVAVDQKLPGSAAYTFKQHIAIQFSEQMRLQTDEVGSRNTILAGITVAGPGGRSYTGQQLAYAYDNASQTMVITFPGVPNEELVDGNWTVTLNSSAFQDADNDPTAPGTVLDGDGNGSAGGNYVASFYVLKGDTQVNYSGARDPNRKIDFTDYQRLELNYGKGPADRVAASDGDFNHDGFVNDLDLPFVRGSNFGKTLPAEPVIVAAPTPVPLQPAPVKTVTKPTAKPTAKPVAKPNPASAKKATALATAPKPTVFANKKITGLKDLLATKK